MQTPSARAPAPLQPSMKTQADYLAHIRMMAKLDQEYAQYIYSRYVAKLDWLTWPAWEAVK